MIKISKVRRLVAGSLLTASALTCIVPLWGQNNIQTAKAAQEGQYIYSRVFTDLKKNLEKEKTRKELEEKEAMEQVIAREYESLESEIEEYLGKYTDYPVPDNKPFKSYMDAETIKDKSSKQYAMKSTFLLDYNMGIYMVGNRYACALGSFYSTDIGTEFDIVLESGEVIPCVLADVKDDEHTDSLNQYTVANDSIVEFVVHTNTLIPNISNRWGNTGDVSKIAGFEGEIAYIRIYERE